MYYFARITYRNNEDLTEKHTTKNKTAFLSADDVVDDMVRNGFLSAFLQAVFELDHVPNYYFGKLRRFFPKEVVEKEDEDEEDEDEEEIYDGIEYPYEWKKLNFKTWAELKSFCSAIEDDCFDDGQEEVCLELIELEISPSPGNCMSQEENKKRKFEDAVEKNLDKIEKILDR